jgi:hypothetical protein
MFAFVKKMIATAAHYEQQSGYEELSAQFELRLSADKLVNRRKYKKRV